MIDILTSARERDKGHIWVGPDAESAYANDSERLNTSAKNNETSVTSLQKPMQILSIKKIRSALNTLNRHCPKAVKPRLK